KADARWLCALPNDDIVVGYPGPSLCVHAHAYPGPVTRDQNIILVVSTLEPRKNAHFLLDWYLNTDALADGVELWWVGPSGWLSRIRNPAPDSDERRRVVRFLGVIPDHELCALYRRASFTIYPSLYEGFGFPVLDSLLHGAPVLCSLNSSLQEFACPGVFYFDACDPVTLDDAYRDLCDAGPIVIDQDALRERFSWDALARTVVELCA